MPTKAKGFTLIELSVVLVIVGLLLGAVLGVGMSQIQNSKITATKLKQEVVRLGLVSFIARNNRLPCPAVAGLPPLDPNYGREAATAGVCTGTITAGGISTGIVPFVTLGITDENATDGYYNRFTYHVVLAATNTTAQTVAGMRGAFEIYPAAPPVAANIRNDCTPVSGVFNPCLSVAVIVSHGNNGFGSYSTDGSQRPAPPGIDEQENVSTNNVFIIRDFSDSQANPFDDILLPLSVPDVLLPLTTRGAIDDFRTALNKSFSNITAAAIANAVTNRAGAPGAFNYPVPIVTPLAVADPWNNPITYLQVTATINSTTPPNAVAFTLTSFGPDGLVGGNDDIAVAVSVAELQSAFGRVGW